MWKLAVCSDGMAEAKPRLFRQNRPASEYITPLLTGAAVVHTRVPEKEKKVSFDNYRENYVPSREMKKGTFWTKFFLSKTKKWQRCSICVARNERRERNNRLYVQNRVRTNRVSLYIAALRRQVQVLVTLTTKHDWAGSWPTSIIARATLL